MIVSHLFGGLAYTTVTPISRYLCPTYSIINLLISRLFLHFLDLNRPYVVDVERALVASYRRQYIFIGLLIIPALVLLLSEYLTPYVIRSQNHLSY